MKQVKREPSRQRPACGATSDVVVGSDVSSVVVVVVMVVAAVVAVDDWNKCDTMH